MKKLKKVCSVITALCLLASPIVAQAAGNGGIPDADQIETIRRELADLDAEDRRFVAREIRRLEKRLDKKENAARAKIVSDSLGAFSNAGTKAEGQAEIERSNQELAKYNQGAKERKTRALQELKERLAEQAKKADQVATNHPNPKVRAAAKKSATVRRRAAGVITKIARNPGVRFSYALMILSAMSGFIDQSNTGDVLSDADSPIKKIYDAMRDDDCIALKRLARKFKGSGKSVDVLDYLKKKFSGVIGADAYAGDAAGRIASMVIAAAAECDKRDKDALKAVERAKKCSFDDGTLDEFVTDHQGDRVTIANVSPVHRFSNEGRTSSFCTMNREDGETDLSYVYDGVIGYLLDEPMGDMTIAIKDGWSPGYEKCGSVIVSDCSADEPGIDESLINGYALVSSLPGTVPLYLNRVFSDSSFCSTEFGEMDLGSGTPEFSRTAGYIYTDHPIILDLAASTLNLPPQLIASCAGGEAHILLSVFHDLRAAIPDDNDVDCWNIDGEAVCIADLLIVEESAFVSGDE